MVGSSDYEGFRTRLICSAHIIVHEVMSPFAREALEKAAKPDKTLVISTDESHISAGYCIERRVLIMAPALCWVTSCSM